MVEMRKDSKPSQYGGQRDKGGYGLLTAVWLLALLALAVIVLLALVR